MGKIDWKAEGKQIIRDYLLLTLGGALLAVLLVSRLARARSGR